MHCLEVGYGYELEIHKKKNCQENCKIIESIGSALRDSRLLNRKKKSVPSWNYTTDGSKNPRVVEEEEDDVSEESLANNYKTLNCFPLIWKKIWDNLQKKSVTR